MKKISVVILLMAVGVFGKELPLNRIVYDEKYEKYSFNDWENIQEMLESNALKGNNIATTNKSSCIVKEMIRRLAKMKLTVEQKEIVKKFLVKFLDEYLSNKRFVEFIKSDVVKNMQMYSRFDGILSAPEEIIRTLVVLNLNNEQVTRCIKMITEVPSKRMRSDYFGHFVACSTIFDKWTNIKQLTNDETTKYTEYEKKMIRFYELYVKLKEQQTQKNALQWLNQEYTEEQLKSYNNTIELRDFCSNVGRSLHTAYKNIDVNTVIFYLKSSKSPYKKYFWAMILNSCINYKAINSASYKQAKTEVITVINEFKKYKDSRLQELYRELAMTCKNIKSSEKVIRAYNKRLNN